MSKVKISDLAEEDLSEIWFFIAQDNIEAADAFIDTILEKCHLIASSPRMGTERSELAPDVRSFPVGNYVIFYRQSKAGIEVARILSGSRDIPRLFEAGGGSDDPER